MVKKSQNGKAALMAKTGLAEGTMHYGISMVVNVATALIRYKAIAVLLGAAGLGLYGLLLNLLSTVSALAGLGVPFSLSGALGRIEREPEEQRNLVANAMLAMTLTAAGLSIITVLCWPLMRKNLGDELDVLPLAAWLFPAILLTLWNGILGATLMGLGQAKIQARITMFASVISTAAGVVLIWFVHTPAVVGLIIFPPLVGTAFSVSKLWKMGFLTWPGKIYLPEFKRALGELLPTGMYFMLSSAITFASILVAQSMVAVSVGLAAVGGFQAAYSVSIQIMGFLTLALQSNLYPALSTRIGDRKFARQASNENARLLLVTAGILFILITTLSQVFLTILFTTSFATLSAFLTIWFLGDTFKLLAWILGINLLSTQNNKNYLIAQLAGNIGLVATVWAVLWFDLPFSYVATGNLVFGAVTLLVSQLYVSQDRSRFWDKSVLATTVLLSVILLLIALLHQFAEDYSVLGGIAMMLIFLSANITEIKETAERLRQR